MAPEVLQPPTLIGSATYFRTDLKPCVFNNWKYKIEYVVGPLQMRLWIYG